MSNPALVEIALYVGIALVLIWVVYRLYVSFTIKNEGFANQELSKGVFFTMYYADWCGHCQRAKPEFMKLGSTQTIGGKQVQMRMVNPETNPDDKADVDVKGYPTIVLKKGTTIIEYSGERIHSAFLSFLQQNV
jgi:thiol-disulfide isomerase/thioredoxin